MSIDGIGEGFGSGLEVTATQQTGQEQQTMDRQTFGAAVVSETLDRMNTDSFGNVDASYDFQKQVLGAFAGTGSGNGVTAVDKETFGASVVTATLDTMNSDQNDLSSSYDFNKQVLGAYAGNGTILDTKS